MNYLNRCYIRKCRLSAVRLAAARQPRRMKRRLALRVALGAALCLELLWAWGRVPLLPPRFSRLIQVQSIEERSELKDGSLKGFGEVVEDGGIKEGIRIDFDEKAISIFRIKEGREQVND